MAGDTTVLAHYLAPLRQYLDRPGVTELVINRPGELAIEVDGGWTWVEAPELTEAFCARVMSCEPLAVICARPDMPGQATVHSWAARRPEFAAAYEAAMRVRADWMADAAVQALELDAASARMSEDGKRLVRDNAALRHAALKVKTLQWAATQGDPPGGSLVLLRRETDVGHGGRSIDRTIGLNVDTLSFLAAQLGLAEWRV